jgi:bacterioferritin (cytochrome b1)
MEYNDNPRLIEALNRMLAKEHGCAIRYATHAAMVTGPYVDPVSRRFQEIASDEITHAGKLRKRICALGGTPTMEVDAGDLPAALTLGEMIEVNIREERGGIEEYSKILENIPRLNVLLCRTLEDILKDEQEHLEELRDLAPMREQNGSRKQARVRLDARTGVTAQQPGQMSSLDSRD